MLVTAPLSVSGEGCGLWNTRRSLKSLTHRREPSASVISAPRATRRASISAHRFPDMPYACEKHYDMYDKGRPMGGL